jgi:hypothetical protein
VVHPVATLKVAVAVVAMSTKPIDLNDNHHQPSFEATALNYKAASLIAATTNKLTPL